MDILVILWHPNWTLAKFISYLKIYCHFCYEKYTWYLFIFFSVRGKPIFISVVFLIFATGGLTSSFHHKTGKKIPLSLGFKFLRKRPSHMLPSGCHMKAVPCTELFIYTCASKMDLSFFSTIHLGLPNVVC